MVANLSDLPPNSDLAAILEKQAEIEEEKRHGSEKHKGSSSRVKLLVEYNDEERKYKMSDDDKAVLIRYDIEYSEFIKTTKEIEGNVGLRPFEMK